MAYIIGNTTVIDSNGALGSIDGNSLNIANNNNVSAGASVNYNEYNSSSNFAVSNLGVGMIGVRVGGGGGQAQVPNKSGPGGRGGIAVDTVDLSGGGNITVTVGNRGNNVNNGTAPSGGASNFSIPLSPRTAKLSNGGSGGRTNPNPYSGSPGSGFSHVNFVPGKGNQNNPGFAYILGIS